MVRPGPAEEPQSHTIKFYYQDSEVARSYDGDRFVRLPGRVLNYLERRTIARALGMSSPRPTRKQPLVLDAPCGTGRITEWLLELGCDVIAADIARPMLAVARSRCARFGNRVSFLQTDLDSLGLPDSSVDVATCVRLFHHLTTEQRARILAELGRVARETVIVNMSFSSPYYRMRRRLKRALHQGVSRTSSTLDEIQSETSSAGLRIGARCFVAPFLSEDLFLVLRRPDRIGTR